MQLMQSSLSPPPAGQAAVPPKWWPLCTKTPDIKPRKITSWSRFLQYKLTLPQTVKKLLPFYGT